MSRASAVGKVAVLASSMLLAGAYVSSQAGWVRLPFAHQTPPRTLIASSKSRAIGPVLTSRLFDPPPAPLPYASGNAMMVSSKSGAVYPLRQFIGTRSNGASPSLTASMPTDLGSVGNATVVLVPPPAAFRGNLEYSAGTLTLPSTQPTTQPLLSAKVPSMNNPSTFSR